MVNVPGSDISLPTNVPIYFLFQDGGSFIGVTTCHVVEVHFKVETSMLY